MSEHVRHGVAAMVGMRAQGVSPLRAARLPICATPIELRDLREDSLDTGTMSDAGWGVPFGEFCRGCGEMFLRPPGGEGQEYFLRLGRSVAGYQSTSMVEESVLRYSVGVMPNRWRNRREK